MSWLKSDIALRDIVSINWKRLRNKKLRSILTVCGIGIGIAAVMFLVGLTFGLQKLVVERVAGADSLLTIDVLTNEDTADVIKLDEDAIKRLAAMPEAAEISKVKQLNSELTAGAIKTQVPIYGVESSYFRLSGRVVTWGNLFTDSETDRTKIIISSATAKLLNYSQPAAAINQKVLVSLFVPTVSSNDGGYQTETTLHPLAEPYTIVGVTEDEANYIFMPLENLSAVPLDQYFQLKVKARDRNAVVDLKNNITGLGYTAVALVDTLDQMNNIFSISQIVFGAIGLIALFIAAIGMFNTMTIALLERTKEIGIMKAIGATDQAIKRMFMVESIIIGFLGGLVGIGLGYGAIFLLNFVVGRIANAFGGNSISLFYIPPWFLAAILIFSLMIGWLTGLYPARRAAKLNPLDALRYE